MTTLSVKTIRSAVLVTLVVGLVGFGSVASARGGGGGGGGDHGGGGGGGSHDDGFSGGSMRDSGSGDHSGDYSGSVSHEGDVTTGTGKDGGSYAEGPHGGEVAVAPDGATAVRAPDGATAVRGPDGATAVRGPDGAVAVGETGHGEVYANDYHGAGWDGYYGDGYGYAAGAIAVGVVVESLPDSADRVIVDNQTYYMDNDVYYQSCYQGSAVNYCVVDDPT